MGLTRLNQGVRRAVFLLQAPGETPSPPPFRRPEARPQCLACGPASLRPLLLLSHLLSDRPAPHYKDFVMTLSPPGSSRIMAPAKSLLPCLVTNLLGLGLGHGYLGVGEASLHLLRQLKFFSCRMRTRQFPRAQLAPRPVARPGCGGDPQNTGNLVGAANETKSGTQARGQLWKERRPRRHTDLP